METVTPQDLISQSIAELDQYRDDGAYIFHHPPKFAWNKEVLANSQVWKDFSIYLHVPFCRRICTFCTFERKQVRKHSISDFVGHFTSELKLIRQLDDFSNGRVRSIYLGGGTASLLPNHSVDALLNDFRTNFGITETIETTLECEPGTKGVDDFRELRDMGINRVSIGVQALQDRHLTTLNRAHSAHHSLAMIDAVQEAGIDNLHVDLIYGLPGQTLSDWQATIDKIMQLNVKHVSIYQLIVFPNELLHRKLIRSELPALPYKNSIQDMRQYAVERFNSAGLLQYSLTEFCQPGRECKYVTTTWDGSDYLGLGPGAYSRNGFALWENDVIHPAYERKLSNGIRPVGKSIYMSPQLRLERDIAMGLCLLQVDIYAVERLAGATFADRLSVQVEDLATLGLVELQDGLLSLTQLGVQYATHVMKALVS